MFCSPDDTCGVGCGGGGGGPTSTPGGGGGGATSTPGPGTPTVTPVATATPAPVGTIRARAVQVDPADTSCTAIRAIPTTNGEINGATLGFTSNSENQPTPLVQSGADYVTFASQPAGTYTLDPVLPSADWVLAGSCWSNSNGNASIGFNTALGDGETLTWDIGYMLGSAWVQTEGGDVYASGTIRSYLPDVTPRVFSRDGDGGYPGVVTYGTTYDFDGGSADQGGTYVSSANWLVNETRITLGYYDFFYRRFGARWKISTLK